MTNKIRISGVFLAILLCTGVYTYGQQAPVIAHFFQQEYLFNPAHIGKGENKGIDALLRRPVGSNKDVMRESYLYGMYGFGKHGAGVGFNMNNNGIFKHTEVGMMYAFHLRLDEAGNTLSMGTNVQYEQDQVDIDAVRGDLADPRFDDYDRSGFDANIGLAYTSSHISVNVAVNNLFTQGNDYLMQLTPNLYGNIRYRIAVQDMEVTPMVAYRQVPKKGRHTEDNTELDPRNIVDFGVSAAWNNQFAIYAMYNTERSASLGLSAAFQRFEVQVGYTMPPADVRRVGIHGMDIGLRYRWQ